MGDIERVREPSATAKLVETLKRVARKEDRHPPKRDPNEHQAKEDAVELTGDGDETPTLILVPPDEMDEEGGLDIAV